MEVAEAAVSTAGDDAGPTPDQIIDNAIEASADEGSDTATTRADDAAPMTPATGEDKAAEAKEPAQVAGDEKPNLDERFAEESVPEDWKSAMKALKNLSPEVGKQIKLEHYQLGQYKELLPLEEAREMRTMFTSLDEARNAYRASADLVALDFTLKNDPGKFVDYLRQKSPEGYANLANEFPRALFDADPVAYKDTFAKPIVERFLGHWDNLATESGNEYLKEAVSALREAAANWEKSNGAPPDQGLRDRLSQYEQRDAQQAEHGVRSFVADIDRTFVSTLREQTQNALERAGATGLSPDARKMVVDRVVGEIYEKLRSDAGIRNYVGFSSRGGSRDANHQRQIVEYLVNRAKPMIGHNVRTSVAWMTDNIVAENRSRLDKERRVSSQKPISTGAPTGSDRGSIEWSKIPEADRKRMSLDDILDASARGRFA